MRNFLRAEAWDDAIADSDTVIAELRRSNQTIGVASFLAEVLAALPGGTRAVAGLQPEAGDAHFALGQGDEARTAFAAALAIREQLAAAEPERADYQRGLSASYTRLATIAERNGRVEEARTWYERDLAISEKLAAIDPKRADYQVDVVISLMNTARYAGSAARALLKRAASILRTLDAEGRLVPADRGKIDTVARMLAALP